MKNRYIILIAVVLGIIACYFVYDYLTAVEKAASIEYEEVIVAAGDIAAKSIIRDEMLEKIRIHREAIHTQAARKIEDVAGNVTLTQLVKGEQVLINKTAKPGDPKNGLGYIVPPGKRAMTVAVDGISGVAGFIRPGDRVDVTAVVNIPENDKEVPYSLMVLQDVQVLAAGIELEDKGDRKTSQDYNSITLAITAEQAPPLLLASQKGYVRLMLRSPADDSTVSAVPFKAVNFLK